MLCYQSNKQLPMQRKRGGFEDKENMSATDVKIIYLSSVGELLAANEVLLAYYADIQVAIGLWNFLCFCL